MPELTSNQTIADLFGEIAPRFGLSRAAGQCFAAIWRAAQAPSADDLVQSLGLSRSNVSVAVRDLRDIGLVRTARSPGSRKDYLVADADPWTIIRTLMIARERRDLSPLLDGLRGMDQGDSRVAALIAAIEPVTKWMAELGQLSTDDLAQHIAPPKKKKKKKG